MITLGLRTVEISKWRVQFYWPLLTIRSNEIFIEANTCIRIMCNRHDRYYGFGFAIVGFGIGVDYSAR